MKIGYIGLGAMGGSIARWLVEPHDLTVWDINKSAVERMVALGASSAETAEELARTCDVIFLCLPRTADVRQTIFGDRGLIGGLSAGKIVVDQTSGIPAETNGFAEELARKGVAMLDAPVTGGVGAAQAGSVTIIVSGPGEAFDRVAPAFRAISPKVYHCSDRTGDGQALKLVNNAMSAGYRMSALEIVAMGCKSGLPLSTMTEVFRAATGPNFSTKNMLPAILEGRAATNFALALMVKDLNEAIALARTCEVPMPLAGAVRAMMQIGLNTIGKNAMLDDVVPLMETLSGTAIAPTGTETPKPQAAAPAGEIIVGCAGTGSHDPGMAERLACGNGVRVATAADLPALARACDTVVVAEPSAGALRVALFGPGGLAEGLSAGKIVVARTVADPVEIEALAADVADRGSALVDLAVSADLFGGPEGPRAWLVAGPEEAVAKVRPALDVLAPGTIYCGAAGMAQLARVADRALAACNAIVTYESAAVGVKFGLDIDALATILNAGSGWSGMAERLLPALGGRSVGGPVEALERMAEDLQRASSVGARCGAPMLITDQVLGTFEAARNALAGQATLIDLARRFESDASTRYANRG